jgi:hypothetical protein
MCNVQENPASLTSKSAVTTLVVGLALLVPAAIGLNDIGPTVIHPLPALTILPAFFLAGSHLWKAAVVIPTLLFFAWNPGLLFGDGKIPKKSCVLLAILTVLSVVWFVGGWKFGVEYQGAEYTYTVCILNVALICFLGLVFATNWGKESSFSINLVSHWILFAWLAWIAFPYLGEMP